MDYKGVWALGEAFCGCKAVTTKVITSTRVKNAASDYISHSPNFLPPAVDGYWPLRMGSAKTEMRCLKQLTEHRCWVQKHS